MDNNKLYRWVKASERLPEKENVEYGGKYAIRYYSLGEIQLWTHYEVIEHQQAGYVFEWLEVAPIVPENNFQEDEQAGLWGEIYANLNEGEGDNFISIDTIRELKSKYLITKR